MRTVIPLVPAIALIAFVSVGCAAPQKPSSTARPPAPSARPAERALPAAEPAPAAPPAPAEAPQDPRAPDAVQTGLRFEVEPPAALIAIDGRDYGSVGDVAAGAGLVPLAPGIYQVSLKASGFVTWRAEVAVRQGTEKIKVTLSKKK